MSKGRPKGFDENVVLEKAMQTFWREGYAGASMSLLLKDMGISRQSLYDTYGDKRALFLQTLRLYISHDIAEITNILNSQLPEKEKITSVIFHYRKMALQEHSKGCYLINSLINMGEDDRELSNLLNGALEDIYQALLGAVQAGIDKKEITSGNPATVISRGVLNSLIGLAASSKANRQQDDVDLAVTSITNGLA